MRAVNGKLIIQLEWPYVLTVHLQVDCSVYVLYVINVTEALPAREN